MLKGELAALSVSFCWTFTAIFFEAASKRLGSLSVNVIRLLIALVLFTLYSLLFYGRWFPAADAYRLLWLGLSGFIGFFIGDLFLFKALVLAGSKMSMLIMSLAPVFTAVLGYLFLSQVLSGTAVLAIALTLAGITIVILFKKDNNNLKAAISWPGIGCALIGAVCQAVGIILSKKGVDSFDPFLATDIRVIAGFTAFLAAVVVSGRLKKTLDAFKDLKGVGYSAGGAVMGPFLGVSLSLYSVKYIPVGIASILMALVPVVMIPTSMIFFKDKFRPLEALGIIAAVAGVAVLFLAK